MVNSKYGIEFEGIKCLSMVKYLSLKSAGAVGECILV